MGRQGRERVGREGETEREREGRQGKEGERDTERDRQGRETETESGEAG